MARIRTQLAIQVPPAFLARLKAEATAQGRTVTSLAMQWLEAGLAGASTPAPAAELLDRLAAVEDRLASLEARERASRGPAAKRPPAPAAPPSDPPTPPLERTGGRLTTTDLARATGTSAGAWNRWAAGHASGSVRQHPTAGSWRLLGKEPPPADLGGPPRWLWEKVT